MGPTGPLNEPCFDAFVTKFNGPGNALVYSTYIGGSSNDGGSRIRVDAAGDVFVAWGSSSTDFPIVSGAYQSQIGNGGSAVLFELSPSGSALVFSTYFGVYTLASQIPLVEWRLTRRGSTSRARPKTPTSPW